MVQLAGTDSLKQPVIDAAMDMLRQNNWRGCEQACVVLAKLDHKESGKRMVELLAHKRGEVRVASAWGLTQLRVPDLLPDMLEHGMEVYRKFKSKEFNSGMPGYADQIGHLFMAFGDQKYVPADKLVNLYLPKDLNLGVESRAGAYWAAGMLHEKDASPSLIKTMITQMNDTESLIPEVQPVRLMCLVSLTRIKAKEALPSFEKYAAGRDGLALAAQLSLEKLTGKPMPEIPLLKLQYDDWILMPESMRK